MSKTSRLVVLFAVLVVSLSADRATKSLATNHLANRPSGYSFAGDFIRLDYSENRGAFLGLGANWSAEMRTLLFTIFVSIAIAGVVAFLVSAKKMRRIEAVALSMIVSGGIGNLIDRLHEGFVTDFMSMGIGSLRTGIFNVADFAITVGVLLLLIPERKKSLDATAPVK